MCNNNRHLKAAVQLEAMTFPGLSGNFSINLDISTKANGQLHKLEVGSFAVYSKTTLCDIIRAAKQYGIKAVIQVETRKRTDNPEMRGTEIYYTHKRSQLLACYIAEALCARGGCYSVPLITTEPSNSITWSAARQGVNLVRINLGYLSNYLDSEMILSRAEQIAEGIAAGTAKYLSHQPRRPQDDSTVQ